MTQSIASMENACFMEQVSTEWMLFGCRNSNKGYRVDLIARTATPWRSWRSGSKLGSWKRFWSFFTVGWLEVALDKIFTKHAVFDSSTCTHAVLVGLHETIHGWGPIPWRSMFPRSRNTFDAYFLEMQIFHQLSVDRTIKTSPWSRFRAQNLAAGE